MTEQTNPLIAAFLKLQAENPQNMFEFAKKAKKDYDGDGKVESPKDEVWGSRFKAAKKAGKMEEAMDSDVVGGGAVTKSKTGYVDPSTPKVPYSELPKPGNAAGDVLSKAKNAAGMKEEKVKKEDVESSKLPKDFGEEIAFSESELAHFSSILEVGAPVSPTAKKTSANDVKGDAVDKRDLTDEVVQEGRKKKVEEPQTTERDAKQHIQVIAGQAAAGRSISFKHNNGKTTDIGPEMGRKITSHLNSLKPAERHAKVKAMHDSPEGMKV
jgi:hypothetical protein